MSQGKRKERKKKGGKQRVAREGEAVSYARCAVASPSASHAVAAASSAMEGRRGEGKREGEAEKRKEDETKKKTASPQRARAHHCDAVCVPSSSSSSGGDRCGLRSCTYTGRRAGERRAHAQEGGGRGESQRADFSAAAQARRRIKSQFFSFFHLCPARVPAPGVRWRSATRAAAAEVHAPGVGRRGGKGKWKQREATVVSLLRCEIGYYTAGARLLSFCLLSLAVFSMAGAVLCGGRCISFGRGAWVSASPCAFVVRDFVFFF